MNPPLALVYHAVRPLSRPWDLLERALVVDPEVFACQMEHLAAGGYRTLTLREYAAALRRPRPPERRILLTFDDAIEGLDDFVTPVLQRHGYTAVVFAPWAHLGGLNTWDGEHPVLSALRVMPAGPLRALAAGPWEIGSHGARHVDLRTIEPADRRRELGESRQGLSDLAGQPVRALAYPFGYQDHGVRRDAAAAGFEVGFVASPYDSGDCFRLPRRPVTDLDRGRLIDLRISAVPWVYRLEDTARIPVRATRLAHAAIRRHRGDERHRPCS
ncbi:MAG: polysaccharide deacetylase family protein [bacterium]|jgi:peptidoglycan/xylan/chitin deacetylase (PgdA/CDA1 family)|nr:polysaccharide deacetylase family protein [bacterium]